MRKISRRLIDWVSCWDIGSLLLLRSYIEDQNLGRSIASTRGGDVEPMKFLNEERGACAWLGLYPRDGLRMIGCRLIDDVHDACPAGDVDACARAVVVDVVRVIFDRNVGRYGARAGVENQQTRRLAASHEEATVGFVERNRVVGDGL